MPLVSSKIMLQNAQKGGYAIGAFNIENMETAQAVIAAAVELNAPVIMQTTPSTAKYAGFKMYAAIAKCLADNVTVPVAMNYDHGSSFDTVIEAMMAGYTSVMFDGSLISLEENMAITKRVAETAKAAGVTSEAELGKVGGKEDDHDGGTGGYTDPNDAVEFIKTTGIDSLAIAIGTAHGIYAGEPKLDVERLIKIRKAIENLPITPLVLHGASGLSDAAVKECIKEGICKVNFATELRIAYTKGVKDYINENPKEFDPKKYGASGIAKVKALVMDRMIVCGAAGKAV